MLTSSGNLPLHNFRSWSSQHNQDLFRFHHSTFYDQFKSKVENILTKTTVLRINLNIDEAPTVSHTHSFLPLTNFSSLIHFPLLRSPILPVCTRLSPSPVLSLSLSLHRDPYLCISPTSRFIHYTIEWTKLLLWPVRGFHYLQKNKKGFKTCHQKW